MKDLSYTEILKANQELGRSLTAETYNIAAFSNSTINLLKEILEYSLRAEGIPAKVHIGDYDNIVQDARKYCESNGVIIFWELWNVLEGLPYKAETWDEKQLNELLEKVKGEIDFTLKNLQKTPFVILNKFSALPFNAVSLETNRFEQLARQLNRYLEDHVGRNVHLIDLDKVIAGLGLRESVDLRHYYSSKALYTVNFYRAYAQHIMPFFCSVNGKSKKAIIFDCDNTLWKGILGEDGMERIEMSPTTKDGAIFAEIQALALALAKQGVIIGLCSKNNYQEVEELIARHPDMQLRDEHIAIKKINWSDKAVNLRAIVQELNIGLDSIVYVDDSPFEIDFVRREIPEVKTFQVPDKLYDYPRLMREHMNLFYKGSSTEEDISKIKMYKRQLEREEAKKEFVNMEEYFASLKLKMTIFENDESLIPRISQMCQKTNQFNLTTKRYTENEIKNFICHEGARVYAFSVSDKFGDSGVTGVSIAMLDAKSSVAEIDTFLMSCRVIGRNLEYAFMDQLVEALKQSRIKTVKANYIQTAKNGVAKNFYDECSFILDVADKNSSKYVLDISRYRSKNINYIEVRNGRKDQENFIYSA